ncbi:MAG: hypothetical protein H7336_13465 [Bacteriovorax sp.]|nr:hypothetical protein [Bacteriovorax sp.]
MKPLKFFKVFSIFIAFTFIFTRYAHASDISNTPDIEARIPPAGDSFLESPFLEKEPCLYVVLRDEFHDQCVAFWAAQ